LLVYCWILATAPALLEKCYFGAIISQDWINSKHSEVKEVDPIVPEDMLDAYDYGMIIDRLQIA
jgi:hypothetical protein